MFFSLQNINLFADERTQDASSSIKNTTTNDIIIEADSLESILDRKLRASGSATILKGNQSITADFIEYDQISEELYAKGKIKITTPDLELKGSELEMSLAENTGSIANGSFVANINQDSTSKFNKELRGTATQIFLEGEDKKKLENAKITTCEAGQNEWFITSSETIIDQSSGNIKAKDAKLSLKGVPIMYSPYVDFSPNFHLKVFQSCIRPMLTFQQTLKEGLAGYFLQQGQQAVVDLRPQSPTTLIYRPPMTQP